MGTSLGHLLVFDFESVTLSTVAAIRSILEQVVNEVLAQPGGVTPTVLINDVAEFDTDANATALFLF